MGTPEMDAAAAKSPRARRNVSRVITAPPPADWPAIVTRAGSPAELADVAPHPLQRKQPVEVPRLARIGQPTKAVEAEPIGHGDRNDAVTVERRSVIPRTGR